VQDRLQNYLTNYTTGIRVSKVNVDDSKPPTQVQAAFDDVIKAREDEERVKNEAQSYANGIVPEARGKAQRQIEEASAYREQVIANAEGEADRFQQSARRVPQGAGGDARASVPRRGAEGLSKTSKVMVDVEGGNNMMYLPLDKLARAAAAWRAARRWTSHQQHPRTDRRGDGAAASGRGGAAVTRGGR
jgi:membrane protease subunit HflK